MFYVNGMRRLLETTPFGNTYALNNHSIAAEDAYATALDKIERLPRTPFFNEQTMYETAVAQYEISLSRTVAGRRELLKAMKLQLQSLNTLRVRIGRRWNHVNDNECFIDCDTLGLSRTTTQEDQEHHGG